MNERPSREEFDAMNDAEFQSFWESQVEAAQSVAASDAEVQAVFHEWGMACDRRFGFVARRAA